MTSESNGTTPPVGTGDPGRATVIQKTAASAAALHAIITYLAPWIDNEQQAIDVSVLIRDFTEQAIRDERARLRALIEAERQYGWIELPADDMIQWLGLDG